MNQLVQLSNEAIRRVAPSVFATEAWEGVSDKYEFIPTIGIVDALRSEGFFPVKVQQSLCRIPGKRDFTKHLIRFRREADMTNLPRVVNGNAHHFYAKDEQPIIPEVVLTNSHDRSGSFVLDAGLFRQLCSNGLIVSAGSFGSIRTRHVASNAADNVIEGVYSVVEEFPHVLEQVNVWQQKVLNERQQLAFAAAACELRWGDTAPVRPEQLLQIRRAGDRPNDVFTTMNRIQENIIKGGVRGRGKTNKRLTTRAVNSVNEDVRLNKALWRLTEELAKAV